MSRAELDRMFAESRREGRAVLLPYLTAGLPDVGSAPVLFAAMADAGADGFEIGIPYSDPLMDGPTIQEAAARALAGGTTIDAGLKIVERVVTSTGKPALVMTYVNPVLMVGPQEFARRIASAGAAGIIVADLPVEESEPIAAAARDHGLGMVLFAAPTTDESRLRAVAAADPVFIYGIAELGVTGERTEASSRAAALAEKVRMVTDAPLVLGIGISTPEHVARAAAVADGVIVGSALVRRVLDASDAAAAATALSEAVGELRTGLRR